MSEPKFNVFQFVDYLENRQIHFDIRSPREGSIMFTLVLVGARIEVEFFEDHIEYSVFTGTEQVSRSVKDLIAMINQHWD